MDPLAYEQILMQSGYYNHPILRFLQYIGDFFTGNWGKSYTFITGIEVTDILKDVTPKTIEILIMPISIGLLVGIFLRRIRHRNERKRFKRLIKIILGVGISVPLFSIIITLQLEFSRYFEVMYSMSPTMIPPPYLTGFPLFDSIISGNWMIASDISMHYLLPVFSLILVIVPLFALQASSPIENRTIFSNSQIIGKNFLYIFIYVLVVELSFNFTGFGYNFYLSIIFGEIFLINGFFYLTLLLICTVFLVTNLIFIIYNGYKSEELRRPSLIVKILNRTVINHNNKPVKN
jgi:ABC-type dipeptide/oligopeptide/nickel transport system permease component